MLQKKPDIILGEESIALKSKLCYSLSIFNCLRDSEVWYDDCEMFAVMQMRRLVNMTMMMPVVRRRSLIGR